MFCQSIATGISYQQNITNLTNIKNTLNTHKIMVLIRDKNEIVNPKEWFINNPTIEEITPNNIMDFYLSLKDTNRNNNTTYSSKPQISKFYFPKANENDRNILEKLQVLYSRNNSQDLFLITKNPKKLFDRLGNKIFNNDN